MYKVSKDPENWSNPVKISELGLKAYLAASLFPDQYKQSPYYNSDDSNFEFPIYYSSNDEYILELLKAVDAGIIVSVGLKDGTTLVILPFK